ncbi:hypothetical protein [Streptacidiphilus jiangxiensis]|uniref:DNA-directed RNA polymerase specialized sigma subunit, sigma24 family n=1 Tax=Streptacidiphilus jiangxiensis TaxID=235985 RepID=A0A1H8BSI5_STRJI|nr:hypothetical protein [Streptacidiphilus jiangxiensis]SEM85549.1 hypothetical protein SAMN05414137_1772 [Streptacidiphilus jiangxiensis]
MAHPTSAGTQSGPHDSTDMRMYRAWQQVCDDPRAEDIVCGWAAEDEVFSTCAGAGDVLVLLTNAYRAGDWAGHDELLAALLERVPRGGYDGEVAWLITVRALLPKAARMARSQLRPGIDFEEAFSIVVGALFEIVRTYPLERCPQNIYSGLALRTLTLTRESLGHLAHVVDDTPFAPADITEIVNQGPGQSLEPEERFERLSLLMDATELQLLSEDDTVHIHCGTARAEVLQLVVWAVRTNVLRLDEAQLLAAYYVDSDHRDGRTPRSMGTDGDRLRKARSRALSRLRAADHDAYWLAA